MPGRWSGGEDDGEELVIDLMPTRADAQSVECCAALGGPDNRRQRVVVVSDVIDDTGFVEVQRPRFGVIDRGLDQSAGQCNVARVLGVDEEPELGLSRVRHGVSLSCTGAGVQ